MRLQIVLFALVQAAKGVLRVALEKEKHEPASFQFEFMLVREHVKT